MSPGDSLERGGCTNGSAVRERGGVLEWKGDTGRMKGLAVCLPRAGGWPSVLRGLGSRPAEAR